MEYLVSIIVPFYNVEGYIEKCIQSIEDQTYKNWELILVDDGSTDDSYAICNRYAGEDSHIRLFHRDKAGVSSARNYGINEAKGEYILFADSDDWLDKDMLKKMLREGDDADMIVCDAFNVTIKDGEQIISPRNLWKTERRHKVSNKYKEILSVSATLWNKLIKRDIIGNLRFEEDKTYGEDLIFLTKLMPAVESTVIIPDHLYYYLCNREGNVISAKLDKRTIEFLNNSYEVYRLLEARGESSCGIYRLKIAIYRVFDRIDYKRRKKNKRAIAYCGKVLRKTRIKSRLGFFGDRSVPLNPIAKVFFLLTAPFPYAAFCIRKILKKEIR